MDGFNGKRLRRQPWLVAIVAALFLRLSAASAMLPGDTTCNGEWAADDVDLAASNPFTDSPACLTADSNRDGAVTAADIVSVLRYVTAPPAVGPVITYLGLASSDGAAFNPAATINNAAVFGRPVGQGFKIVVEGKPGRDGSAVGQIISNSDPANPGRRPDVWIESSSPLGDGSPAVCDGGVPAIHPPDFRYSQSISNTLNDLACNLAVATSSRFSCTIDEFGSGSFLDTQSQVQFCLQVSRLLSLPDGETLFTVGLRGMSGNLGPLRQILVRIGSGPFAPTSTPTGTSTRTVPPRTVSPTPTRSLTPSFTVPPTVTRTWTSSPLPARTPTFTPSPGRSATPVPSYTVSRTVTPASPALTPTPTSSVAPPTVSGSPTPSATRTITSTAAPATRTASRTRTASVTPPIAAGPVVSYFGLARADDILIQPNFYTPDGVPVYVRTQGFGFSIIVEGKRGANGIDVGRDTFVEDLSALPDLQIIASNPLGDGSDIVCDSSGPNAGGVPRVDPESFEPSRDNINVLNDFGCRFVDGAGTFRGRSPSDACTRVNDDYSFAAADSTVQFCGSIGPPLRFPVGDTMLTVRLLDEEFIGAPPGSGAPGPVSRLIVRIGNPTPATATQTSAMSATRTRTRTFTPGLPTPTRTATAVLATVTRTLSPTRTATIAVVPTRTATPSLPTPTRQLPTSTRTVSRTPTRTRTASVTPTSAPSRIGPLVTYFGVARFDGVLIDPVGTTARGIPIYARPVGAGFTLVVEGGPGSSKRAVGVSSFDAFVTTMPDLQIISSRDLGDGSNEVCDYRLPSGGGVPGIASEDIDTASIAMVNDFACRFRDGQDQPQGRGPNDGCVYFETGAFGFVNNQSTIQFCAAIDRFMEFPLGDTLLTVRMRDTSGNLGPSAQIVVRVGM